MARHRNVSEERSVGMSWIKGIREQPWRVTVAAVAGLLIAITIAGLVGLLLIAAWETLTTNSATT